jgi:cysteine-rich repeat protein
MIPSAYAQVCNDEDCDGGCGPNETCEEDGDGGCMCVDDEGDDDNCWACIEMSPWEGFCQPDTNQCDHQSQSVCSAECGTAECIICDNVYLSGPNIGKQKPRDEILCIGPTSTMQCEKIENGRGGLCVNPETGGEPVCPTTYTSLFDCNTNCICALEGETCGRFESGDEVSIKSCCPHEEDPSDPDIGPGPDQVCPLTSTPSGDPVTLNNSCQDIDTETGQGTCGTPCHSMSVQWECNWGCSLFGADTNCVKPPRSDCCDEAESLYMDECVPSSASSTPPPSSIPPSSIPPSSIPPSSIPPSSIPPSSIPPSSIPPSSVPSSPNSSSSDSSSSVDCLGVKPSCFIGTAICCDGTWICSADDPPVCPGSSASSIPPSSIPSSSVPSSIHPSSPPPSSDPTSSSSSSNTQCPPGFLCACTDLPTEPICPDIEINGSCTLGAAVCACYRCPSSSSASSFSLSFSSLSTVCGNGILEQELVCAPPGLGGFDSSAPKKSLFADLIDRSKSFVAAVMNFFLYHPRDTLTAQVTSTCSPLLHYPDDLTIDPLNNTDDFVVIDQNDLDGMDALTISVCAQGSNHVVSKGAEFHALEPGSYGLKINVPGSRGIPTPKTYQHMIQVGYKTNICTGFPTQHCTLGYSLRHFRDNPNLDSGLHHYLTVYSADKENPTSSRSPRLVKMFRDLLPLTSLPPLNNEHGDGQDTSVMQLNPFKFVIGGINRFTTSMSQIETFNGDITDVKIFDCELSEAEIAQLALECNGALPPVGNTALYVTDAPIDNPRPILKPQNDDPFFRGPNPMITIPGSPSVLDVRAISPISALDLTAANDDIDVLDFQFNTYGGPQVDLASLHVFDADEVDAYLQDQNLSIPKPLFVTQNRYRDFNNWGCDGNEPLQDPLGNESYAFCTKDVQISLLAGETKHLYLYPFFRDRTDINPPRNYTKDPLQIWIPAGDIDYQPIRARIRTEYENGPFLKISDGDGSEENEIFIGRDTAGANADIIGPLNPLYNAIIKDISHPYRWDHSVHNGTLRLSSGATAIGFVSFDTSKEWIQDGSLGNWREVETPVVIRDLIFTLHSENIEFRTDSFILGKDEYTDGGWTTDPDTAIYNSNQFDYSPCTFSESGGKGHVTCNDIVWPTCIRRNNGGSTECKEISFSLYAEILNEEKDTTKDSFYQLQLLNTTVSDATTVGTDASSIRWNDNPSDLTQGIDTYYIDTVQDPYYSLLFYGVKDKRADSDDDGIYCKGGSNDSNPCYIFSGWDLISDQSAQCLQGGGVCSPRGHVICSKQYFDEYTNKDFRVRMYCETEIELEQCLDAGLTCKPWMRWINNPPLPDPPPLDPGPCATLDGFNTCDGTCFVFGEMTCLGGTADEIPCNDVTQLETCLVGGGQCIPTENLVPEQLAACDGGPDEGKQCLTSFGGCTSPGICRGGGICKGVAQPWGPNNPNGVQEGSLCGLSDWEYCNSGQGQCVAGNSAGDLPVFGQTFCRGGSQEGQECGTPTTFLECENGGGTCDMRGLMLCTPPANAPLQGQERYDYCHDPLSIKRCVKGGGNSFPPGGSCTPIGIPGGGTTACICSNPFECGSDCIGPTHVDFEVNCCFNDEGFDGFPLPPSSPILVACTVSATNIGPNDSAPYTIDISSPVSFSTSTDHKPFADGTFVKFDFSNAKYSFDTPAIAVGETIIGTVAIRTLKGDIYTDSIEWEMNPNTFGAPNPSDFYDQTLITPGARVDCTSAEVPPLEKTGDFIGTDPRPNTDDVCSHPSPGQCSDCAALCGMSGNPLDFCDRVECEGIGPCEFTPFVPGVDFIGTCVPDPAICQTSSSSSSTSSESTSTVSQASSVDQCPGECPILFSLPDKTTFYHKEDLSKLPNTLIIDGIPLADSLTIATCIQPTIAPSYGILDYVMQGYAGQTKILDLAFNAGATVELDTMASITVENGNLMRFPLLHYDNTKFVPPVNQWTQMTFTYDSNSDPRKAVSYKNGTKVYDVDYDTSYGGFTNQGGVTRKLQVGAFDGDLMNTYIYGCVLSEDEIAAMAQNCAAGQVYVPSPPTEPTSCASSTSSASTSSASTTSSTSTTSSSSLPECPTPPIVCAPPTVPTIIGEECDDGNTVDGDGCSATCELECIPQSSSEISTPSSPTSISSVSSAPSSIVSSASSSSTEQCGGIPFLCTGECPVGSTCQTGIFGCDCFVTSSSSSTTSSESSASTSLSISSVSDSSTSTSLSISSTSSESSSISSISSESTSSISSVSTSSTSSASITSTSSESSPSSVPQSSSVTSSVESSQSSSGTCEDCARCGEGPLNVCDKWECNDLGPCAFTPIFGDLFGTCAEDPLFCSESSSSSSTSSTFDSSVSSKPGPGECTDCERCGEGPLNVCDKWECDDLGPCAFTPIFGDLFGTCAEDPLFCSESSSSTTSSTSTTSSFASNPSGCTLLTYLPNIMSFTGDPADIREFADGPHGMDNLTIAVCARHITHSLDQTLISKAKNGAGNLVFPLKEPASYLLQTFKHYPHIDADALFLAEDEGCIDNCAPIWTRFAGQNIHNNIGSWQHFAMTYQKDDRAYTYIDGIEKWSNSTRGRPIAESAGTPLTIGALKDEDGTYTDRFFGEMHDVRIYDCALPMSEITNLASLCTATPTSSAPACQESCAPTMAFGAQHEFNNPGDNVIIQDIPPTASATYVSCVKLKEAPLSYPQSWVVADGSAFMSFDDGKPHWIGQFWTTGDASTVPASITLDTTVPINTWTHLALTYDTLTSSLSFSQNGSFSQKPSKMGL